ncbi:MAG: peptidase C39-like family protein [Paenibacillaceae bacterium]|jgi:uncharacterized protein YvpB|nr:peptidase C39-like family protein [Paenibacillaceae bacterium]
MAVLWKGITVSVWFSLTLGLLFSSGLFSALLYGKLTGKEWASALSDSTSSQIVYAAESAEGTNKPVESNPPEVQAETAQTEEEEVQISETSAAKRLPSVRLSAPLILQYPELPSGCEVTTLAMLLNFSGLKIGKMDLVPIMPRDPTPIRLNSDGSIRSWGNPNTGFVGEVTGKAKGFGIFHGALLDLLKQYYPQAVDLTNKSWDEIEAQVSSGAPVIVWTTINFATPDNWVVWDTPIGPLKTTFIEHAVLLTGYDDDYVYVNDPLGGKAGKPVDKQQFLNTWQTMGKQAISYRP